MTLWYDEKRLLEWFRRDMEATSYGERVIRSVPVYIPLSKPPPKPLKPFVYRERASADERRAIARVVRRLRDFGWEWKRIAWVWGYESPSLLMLFLRSLEAYEEKRRGSVADA